MLGVGTRVRLRLDRGCRRKHARHASGQVGTIIAVVTDDVLAPTKADLSDQSKPRQDLGGLPHFW